MLRLLMAVVVASSALIGAPVIKPGVTTSPLTELVGWVLKIAELYLPKTLTQRLITPYDSHATKSHHILTRNGEGDMKQQESTIQPVSAWRCGGRRECSEYQYQATQISEFQWAW